MSDELWVFGYGSLMWRPGFPFAERAPATLPGRRRAFCIYSVHHRGTYERPGLVLGLAPGGSVRGMAEMLNPVPATDGALQSFRFIAMGDDEHRALGTMVESAGDQSMLGLRSTSWATTHRA